MDPFTWLGIFIISNCVLKGQKLQQDEIDRLEELERRRRNNNNNQQQNNNSNNKQQNNSNNNNSSNNNNHTQ